MPTMCTRWPRSANRRPTWCTHFCRPPSSSWLLQTMKTSRDMSLPREDALDDLLRRGSAVVLTETFDERLALLGEGIAVQVAECGEQLLRLLDHRAGGVLGEVEVRAAGPQVLPQVGGEEHHRPVEQ